MPKPSEEDIQHCFGVIGAETSQPDSNQTHQNLQDLTAQENIRLRYKKPQRLFPLPIYQAQLPKNSLNPVSEFFTKMFLKYWRWLSTTATNPVWSSCAPNFPVQVKIPTIS